jgi:hypothetical protein
MRAARVELLGGPPENPSHCPIRTEVSILAAKRRVGSRVARSTPPSAAQSHPGEWPSAIPFPRPVQKTGRKARTIYRSPMCKVRSHRCDRHRLLKTLLS